MSQGPGKNITEAVQRPHLEFRAKETKDGPGCRERRKPAAFPQQQTRSQGFPQTPLAGRSDHSQARREKDLVSPQIASGGQIKMLGCELSNRVLVLPSLCDLREITASSPLM